MAEEARSIAELLAALAERVPLEKAASSDPVGLQAGDPSARARRVGLCHEVSDSVLLALEREPVDLLISYHPLLRAPLRRLVAGASPGGRLWRLARSGTALAVVHTAFDVCVGGAADALADALGLVEASGFGPLYGPESIKIATFVPAEAADVLLEAVAGAGAGRIGNYSHCSFRTAGFGSFFAGAGTTPAVGEAGALNIEPEVRIEFPAPKAAEAAVLAALVAAHPYEEPAYDVYDRRGDVSMVGRIGRAPEGTTLESLAATARERLAAPALRVAGERGRPLSRVAVVPGSGGEFVESARARGADALVSGDLDHEAARSALDCGLALVDPGHTACERPGLSRLLSWLRELAPGVVSLLDSAPEPWRP